MRLTKKRFDRFRRQMRQEARRRFHALRAAAMGKRIAHFLHIGKTGGTAVRHALGPKRETAEYVILCGGHALKFEGVPRGEKAFFFVRDPVSRFVSAFNSRLREGAPHNIVPWSPKETRAFERFPTPNALALALESTDAEERRAAGEAMGAIRHIGEGYAAWFRSVDYVRERADDILLIGEQESLAEDFERFKALTGLSDDVGLPADEASAHRAPAGMDKRLDDRARAALESWYAEDYAILAALKALKAARLAATDR